MRALYPSPIALLVASTALAHGDHGEAPPAGEALYLGNAGVLAGAGETKVVFDPLFRETFGRYQSVPPELEAKLFSGAPPFDDLDAVFVSHFHADHFSLALMGKLLDARSDLHLFAPRQAVRVFAKTGRFGERLHPIDLDYGDAPARFVLGDVTVEAHRVPHRGWPKYKTVQNLVFKVTLNGRSTVVHLGDADARIEHFPAAHWSDQGIDLALPPYWFFDSQLGRTVLHDRLLARKSVGIHVPTRVPEDPSKRVRRYRAVDLFTRPGEVRTLGDRANNKEP